MPERDIKYYYEMGCKWKVELLSTQRVNSGIQYNLRFIEAIHQNKILSVPEKGLEFSVWHSDDPTVQGYKNYCWRLSDE